MRAGRVLFICTGNYYRSRFAEILFNALAGRAGLCWQAESRGVATERNAADIGPISRHTLRGLAARGLQVKPDGRFPLQLQPGDLERADVVIALKEAEHRPLMEERFPAWAGWVEYWDVDDTYDSPPEQAMAEIDRQVRALIGRLAR